MNDYIFDLFMMMITPTVAVFLFIVITFFLRKTINRIHEEGVKLLNQGALIFWVIFLILSASSTSITYKHDPSNVESELNRIQMLNEARSQDKKEIVDLSKPIESISDEDFKKMTDYKNSSQN